MSNEPNVITLDLNGCKYLNEMHERIKTAFDFPEWYGKNWSAFWDLLSEPREYTLVEIKGISALPKDLKGSGEMLIKLIDENKKEWDEYMKNDGKFDRRFEYTITY